MSETSAAPAVAAISIRTTLPTSKWLNATCPKCQQPLLEGQQAVLCPKCYTPHHAQCWRDNNNTCAIDGTPARLIERAPRAAGAGAAPTAERAPVAAAPAAVRPAPAPAPVAAAPPPDVAVPAGPVDPYRYARLVEIPQEADVWRSNVMTVVILLFLWGLIVLGYALVTRLGLLPTVG